MPLPLRRSGDWTPLVPKSTPSLPALVADGPSSVSEDPVGEAELRRLRRGGGMWILGCAAALLVGLAGSFAVVSALGAPKATAAAGAAAVEVAPPPPAATVPPVASVEQPPAVPAAPPASAPKAVKTPPKAK